VIYGLGAALGWGIADLSAAISGRRIGALATLLASQAFAAILVSSLVIASSADLAPLREVLPWLLPSAAVMATAYFCLYRALELGPIAVASPILAAYAVLPVILAVVLLGESLSAVVATGIGVTIGGAALASTDLRALRAGIRTRLECLPWAAAATALFGVGAYVFAWSAKRAGWLPTLWFSRVSITAFVLLSAAFSTRLRAGGVRALQVPTLSIACLVGLVDLLGAVMYARGASLGYVSIVSSASATYPIVPVLGSVLFLRERPAPNQFVGVAFVVAGLLAVGLH